VQEAEYKHHELPTLHPLIIALCKYTRIRAIACACAVSLSRCSESCYRYCR